jgi:hypothetical protein
MMAIIGTAGRKEDEGKLMLPMWREVYREVRDRVLEKEPDGLASGGAAWADHLAVQLYLTGKVDRLHLYLPAAFEGGRFRDTGGYGTKNPGGTTNYYHRKFSAKLGINSLADIEAAIRKGAIVNVDPGGFFGRNSLLANATNSVIALTFGDGDYAGPWISAEDAGLKDGGTAHTWNRCIHHDHVEHICLR